MNLLPPSSVPGPYRVPARPPATGTFAKPSVRQYRPGNGDTLSSIAQRVYGNARRWVDIYNANRQVLDSPNQTLTGADILRIP